MRKCVLLMVFLSACGSEKVLEGEGKTPLGIQYGIQSSGPSATLSERYIDMLYLSVFAAARMQPVAHPNITIVFTSDLIECRGLQVNTGCFTRPPEDYSAENSEGDREVLIQIFMEAYANQCDVRNSLGHEFTHYLQWVRNEEVDHQEGPEWDRLPKVQSFVESVICQPDF